MHRFKATEKAVRWWRRAQPGTASRICSAEDNGGSEYKHFTGMYRFAHYISAGHTEGVGCVDVSLNFLGQVPCTIPSFYFEPSSCDLVSLRYFLNKTGELISGLI